MHVSLNSLKFFFHIIVETSFAFMMNNFGTKEKSFYQQELRNTLKDCYEIADYKTPNSFDPMLIVLPTTDFPRIKYDGLFLKLSVFLHSSTWAKIPS